MQTTSVLFIVLSILLGSSISYFQYYFKVKSKRKITILLFTLRAVALSILFLLLFNPSITRLEVITTKPALNIVVDNSKSIAYFKEENMVKQLLDFVANNNQLKDKFTINTFSFSDDIQLLDSLKFEGKQTNINKAISFLNDVNEDNLGANILITDGNQTLGDDYEYITSKYSTYPIIVGDTVVYDDLVLTQINSNKYSYIKNKFPVEAFITYNGNKSINTNFVIQKGGKVVFRKKIRLSEKNPSVSVNTNLTSTQKGIHFYKTYVEKIDNEKNTTNNVKEFSVEVIDEKSKILLLTSFLHPDLGVFKRAIESNEQRSVDIQLIDNFKMNLQDYQLIILYQPNPSFLNFFETIQDSNQNYMIVTGDKTDWNFINQLSLGFSKNAIVQSENYLPTFNSGFLVFGQEDIGFDTFPPLVDKFGENIVDNTYKTLLYQRINTVETNQPMLVTRDVNNQKSVILFGEGIWKWRAASFLRNNTFADFDKFINNIIQFSSSKKARERLSVDVNQVFEANEMVAFNAYYVDKNYIFDNRASIIVKVYNESKNYSKELPFSLQNNFYKAEFLGLPSGKYTYQISVENQPVTKKGSFIVTNYEIEEQYVSANVDKLKRFAANSRGKVFYKDSINELVSSLAKDDKYKPIQTSKEVEKPLVDWKILMFIIISLLATEWFVRKYHGKI